MAQPAAGYLQLVYSFWAIYGSSYHQTFIKYPARARFARFPIIIPAEKTFSNPGLPVVYLSPMDVYLSPLSPYGCLFVPWKNRYKPWIVYLSPLSLMVVYLSPLSPMAVFLSPMSPMDVYLSPMSVCHTHVYLSPFPPYGCLFVPFSPLWLSICPLCLSHSCLFVPFLPLCLSICPLCLSVTLMSICPLWHPMVVYLSPGKTVTNPGHTQCDTLKKCYKHLILD